MTIDRLFNAWVDKYDKGSRFLLTEGEETLFQSDPFANKVCHVFQAHVFQEHASVKRFSGENEADKFHREAFSTMFNNKEMDVKFKGEDVVSPDVMFGHRDAVKDLIVGMINAMDKRKCIINYLCDWAAINYVWFKKGFPREESISYEFENYHLADGIVLLPTELLNQMEKNKLFDRDKNVFRSWDGTVIPVVLRYDKFPELKQHFDSMAKQLLEIRDPFDL